MIKKCNKMGCTAQKSLVIIVEPGERKRKFSKHSNLDLSLPEDVYIPVEGNEYSDMSQLYTVSSQIGKGKFGSVFLATSKMTGKEVAIKIQSRENEYSILSELSITCRLDHPNIVKPLEFFQDSKFYYIIFEYLSGGELLTEPDQSFPESYTKEVIFKLLSALSHMNKSRIVHRDLKPENILIDSSGDVRIIDFGLSKYFVQGMILKEVVGTPLYMAPEVTSGEYGPECDLWSVGIIMFRMLYGKIPNLGTGKEEILKKLRTGKFEVVQEGHDGLVISSECKNLLDRLLEKNPSKRIKLNEALESPWFSKKTQESTPEWVKERVKMGNRPGKLQLAILQTAASALQNQDIDEAKCIFTKLDKMHQGIVSFKVGGICESVKFSDFVVSVLKNKIMEIGIPLLYEWCSDDGKFSSEKLRKTVSRRGNYFSSALFSKEFESLEEFQRFLS